MAADRTSMETSAWTSHGDLAGTSAREGGRLHLIVGPVGAGKSTFALGLAHKLRAPRMNLDEWMARLFSPDRPSADLMPWYAERAARCIDQIWAQTSQLVALNVDVVLELGLIQRRPRGEFLARVAEAGHPLIIYLLDAPREVRWERVQKRNRERGETFAMVVSLEIFELASDLWEPLSEEECRDQVVKTC